MRLKLWIECLERNIYSIGSDGSQFQTARESRSMNDLVTLLMLGRISPDGIGTNGLVTGKLEALSVVC